MSASLPTLRLTILVTPEGKRFLAHCLELDLAEGGKTPEEAVDNLIETCLAHIGSAIEDDDMEHLFKPAPPEFWAKFYAAQPRQVSHREHKISGNGALTVLSAEMIDAQVCDA
jgi:predicted RNase H-like HicB family nuclease